MSVYDRTVPGRHYPATDLRDEEFGPSHKQVVRQTPYTVRTIMRTERGPDGETVKVKRYRWQKVEAWKREPQAPKFARLDAVAALPRPVGPCLIIRKATGETVKVYRS